MKKLILALILLTGLFLSSITSFAHCDTKDGPVVAAAIKAIEQNNINFALIWIQPAQEKEIKEAFESVMKVRVLSAEAQKLADNYFYETLVRLHRIGEEMPYTGVKPAGTPIDEKILAADKSIAAGNLSPLNNLVPKARQAGLKKRFDKVMSLKQYDINDVEGGRKYVEAYVQFFHFAEGEEKHHPVHKEKAGHKM
jgi:hypothetical protein